MIKKLISSILLIVILFTQAVSYTQAQETWPWYDQSYKQWYVKVYDEDVSPPQEIFGERYTAAQVNWVIYSLLAFPARGVHRLIVCVQKGGIGTIGSCLTQFSPFANANPVPKDPRKSVIATLFPENNQFSFVNYVKQGVKDLSLTPTAHAQQGFGFQALGPLQRLWRTTRDLTYAFFVLIIIIFAFMIMFRVKINPQTVVTIQSAIPKIILTLILVTFSYAIAGLLIDLAYVAIGLVALIIDQSDLIRPIGVNQWQDIFTLLTDGPRALGSTERLGILGWFVVYLTVFWPAMWGATDSIGDLFGGSAIAGGVANVLSFIIIIFVVLWMLRAVIRIFIMLVRTYLSILLSIVFSPILIGFGALLPNSGFWTWIRGLVSNLLVYPVAGFLMFLSIIFMAATFPGIGQTLTDGLDLSCGAQVNCIENLFDTGGSQYWYPPLTLGSQGGEWDPLPILWLFASLGILTAIPHAANIAKGLMTGRMPEQTEDLGAVMAGVGGFIGARAGAVGGWAGRGAWGAVDRNVIDPGIFGTAMRWAGDTRPGRLRTVGRYLGRGVVGAGIRSGRIEAPREILPDETPYRRTTIPRHVYPEQGGRRRQDMEG